jgi:hypothetical protein
MLLGFTCFEKDALRCYDFIFYKPEEFMIFSLCPFWILGNTKIDYVRLFFFFLPFLVFAYGRPFRFYRSPDIYI